MAEAIRVFIGCAPDNLDLESKQVLEYTINKHTSQPVVITWMAKSNDPESPFYGWETSRWATPFSGFRWAVPELCGFTGKAIYMDSDMIVMADLAELWNQDHNGAVLLAKGDGQWRVCVSLWDCQAARDVLPAIEVQKTNSNFHSQINGMMQKHIGPFAGEWNCLDREIKGRPVDHPDIKIIHYTDMRSQPQLRHALPRLANEGKVHWYAKPTLMEQYPSINTLFDRLLADAIEAGYTSERYQ